MKVALCLHGYFNSLSDSTSKGDDGFLHLKKHVLSKVDTDVFIHSWDLDNRDRIIELYKDHIVDYTFEEQLDFSTEITDNNLHLLQTPQGYVSPEIIFSHLYSVQKSFEFDQLKNNDYDIVIKSRFDVGRINRGSTDPGTGAEPVQCITFDPSLDMNRFYMAYWKYLDSEGPADMWFYSNQKNMLEFERIYTMIKEDLRVDPTNLTSEFSSWAGAEDGGIFNTIKAYKWFLLKSGLWDKKQLLKTTWE